MVVSPAPTELDTGSESEPSPTLPAHSESERRPVDQGLGACDGDYGDTLQELWCDQGLRGSDLHLAMAAVAVDRGGSDLPVLQASGYNDTLEELWCDQGLHGSAAVVVDRGGSGWHADRNQGFMRGGGDRDRGVTASVRGPTTAGGGDRDGGVTASVGGPTVAGLASCCG